MDLNMSPIYSNGYLIEYAKRDYAHSMRKHHYHDHFEIYYQLSGERYYFIKDKSYYVKKVISSLLILIPYIKQSV